MSHFKLLYGQGERSDLVEILHPCLLMELKDE